jgi:hypothetical protein
MHNNVLVSQLTLIIKYERSISLKKNKKITIALISSCIGIFIIYLINKLIFFASTLKELLYTDNSNYYNWRFGKIFYTKRGTGTPVLLIHDMDCTSSDYEWKEIVQTLSLKHTVYTIDLLGCGRSDKPKITYTNYLYVQLISDFIKNVIKHKTDIISTGKSASFAIMACFIESDKFGNLILINPSDLTSMNSYPKYKHKLLKYVIECPIIGTLIYNIVVSKLMISDQFKDSYYYNEHKIRDKYINAYYEAAHKGGSSAKYLYSSMRCHYTNINIVHALKEINNSIYLIGGDKKDSIDSILEQYTALNSSIETIKIPYTKHLPQFENPKELLKTLDIFLV